MLNNMRPISLFYLVLLCFTSFVANAQTVEVWSSNEIDSMPCFSSPRVADLNNDGILDIVTGGGYEMSPLSRSITATDGANGNFLWQADGRGQFFGSAIFQDINADGTPDVFMNGRIAQIFAIDGISGNLIWDFYPEGNTSDPADVGLYNFYNMQWLPDQNDDAIKDILVSNGGNHLAPFFDTINRPIGKIMLISGATGSLIAEAEVPDGRETYFAPLAHDFQGNGNLEIIYGTGGEIIRGGLWRAPLSDLLAGDLSNSTQLAYSNPKGFIPPPTLADVNSDGILDILVAGYNGKIRAIDGANNQTIWSLQLPGTETNASPTVGLFTDDFVPDLYLCVLDGVAPSFLRTIQLMIDGATGQIMFQDTLGTLSFATAVAADTDSDGKDEVITSINWANPPSFGHQLLHIDFDDNNTVIPLTNILPGTNLASTPWLGDLNNDNLLDIVYTHNVVSSEFAPHNGYKVRRLSTNFPASDTIAYGSYMGTNYDGKYTKVTCNGFTTFIEAKNSCGGTAEGRIDLHLQGGTAPYIITYNGGSTPPLNVSDFSLQGLQAGNYDFEVSDAEGCIVQRAASIAQVPALQVTIQTTPATQTSTANGSITATVVSGTPPYQYQLNNALPVVSGNFTNLLSGTHTLQITDANGCTHTETVLLDALGVPTTNANELGLQLLPNPASKQLTIKINEQQTAQSPTLTVYDIVGRQVWSATLHHAQTQIDLASWQNGVYFILLRNNSQMTYQTLVKGE